jgi:hypothetical protein
MGSARGERDLETSFGSSGRKKALKGKPQECRGLKEAFTDLGG